MRLSAINLYIYSNRKRNDLDALEIVVNTFMRHPDISIQFDKDLVPIAVVRR